MRGAGYNALAALAALAPLDRFANAHFVVVPEPVPPPSRLYTGMTIQRTALKRLAVLFHLEVEDLVELFGGAAAACHGIRFGLVGPETYTQGQLTDQVLAVSASPHQIRRVMWEHLAALQVHKNVILVDGQIPNGSVWQEDQLPVQLSDGSLTSLTLDDHAIILNCAPGVIQDSSAHSPATLGTQHSFVTPQGGYVIAAQAPIHVPPSASFSLDQIRDHLSLLRMAGTQLGILLAPYALEGLPTASDGFYMCASRVISHEDFGRLGREATIDLIRGEFLRTTDQLGLEPVLPDETMGAVVLPIHPVVGQEVQQLRSSRVFPWSRIAEAPHAVLAANGMIYGALAATCLLECAQKNPAASLRETVSNSLSLFCAKRGHYDMAHTIFVQIALGSDEVVKKAVPQLVSSIATTRKR